MDKVCSICFDGDDLIKTKCNHYFHKNCIKNVIYPKCPLCKCDIFYLLNELGISKKKIQHNINIETNRLFIQNINIEELSMMEKFCIIYNNIRLNKYKWRDLIKKIIIPYIQNSKNILLKFSKMNYFFKNEGIFLYYCDLTDLIINFILNYKTNVLQWLSIFEFKMNKNIKKKINDVYSKVKHNYIDKFGILFVINDDINDEKFIFDKIFYEKTEKTKYMENNKIIESLIQLELKTFELDNINNPEKQKFSKLFNFNKIKKKNLKYHNLKNFVYHKINNIFKKYHNSQNITFIEIKTNDTFINLKIFIEKNEILYKLNNSILTVENFILYLTNLIHSETFLIVNIMDENLYKYVFGYTIHYDSKIFEIKKLSENHLEEYIFREYTGDDILKLNLNFTCTFI